MRAKELRIGNWVYDDGYKCNRTVLADDMLSVVNLNHIQLTEEILLKSGFENVGGWLEFGKISISFDDKRCVMEDEGGESWSKLPYPKYVHTLQNLYFALTGEELEIQL